MNKIRIIFKHVIVEEHSRLCTQGSPLAGLGGTCFANLGLLRTQQTFCPRHYRSSPTLFKGIVYPKAAQHRNCLLNLTRAEKTCRTNPAAKKKLPLFFQRFFTSCAFCFANFLVSNWTVPQGPRGRVEPAISNRTYSRPRGLSLCDRQLQLRT